MDKTTFALFTFANSHLVLKSEKVLETENIRVIPLPTEISSGCGLSIRCELDNKDNIINILNNYSIPFKKVYKITKEGIKKTITELN